MKRCSRARRRWPSASPQDSPSVFPGLRSRTSPRPATARVPPRSGTSTAWEVDQTGTTGGALLPDAVVGTGTIQTKDYHVKNNNAGHQNLANVDISIATAVNGVWSSQTNPLLPACTKDDFSVGGELVGVTHSDTALAGTFTPGQDKTGVTGGTVTVQMIDNGLNQDNCKSLTTVPLYFSAT